MDVLGLKEGSDVADIGAGSGWFTVRAARRVGSSGRVMLSKSTAITQIHLSSRREKLSNVRTVLAKKTIRSSLNRALMPC